MSDEKTAHIRVILPLCKEKVRKKMHKKVRKKSVQKVYFYALSSKATKQ